MPYNDARYRMDVSTSADISDPNNPTAKVNYSAFTSSMQNSIRGVVERLLEGEKEAMDKELANASNVSQQTLSDIKKQITDQLKSVGSLDAQFIAQLKGQNAGLESLIDAEAKYFSRKDEYEKTESERYKQAGEMYAQNIESSTSTATAKQRQQYFKAKKEALASESDRLNADIEMYTLLAANATDQTTKDKYERIVKESKASKDEVDSQYETASSQEAEAAVKAKKQMTVAQTKQFNAQKMQERNDLLEQKRAVQMEMNGVDKNSEEYKELSKHLASINNDIKNTNKEIREGNVTASKAAEKTVQFLASMSDKLTSTIKAFYQYQAKMEGLLQGSGQSYGDMLKSIRDNVAISPIIKQTAVMDNMRTLVESGITYNVELRSFLATISEDIDATFSAFDENLKEIIRVQQQDSTLERLGMESYLTQMYNKMFQDSSYLASNLNSTVQGTLIDTLTAMTKDEAIEFEYIVQKWLGSMSAVGVGSSTISKIAQGINYLATGDVEALSSDASLQMLFSMSANRAGKSYADMLTNGVNSYQINDLMKSMVEYLQEIAETTEDNNVVQKQYSKLLGVSMTDLTAVAKNLSGETINQLYKSYMTAENTVQEYDNQVSQLFSRVNISQYMDNMTDNAYASMADTLGSIGNGMTYAIYKVADLVNQTSNRSLKVPTVSVLGNSVSLGDITFPELLQAGLTGFSMVASMIGMLSNGGNLLGSFGSDTLDRWGYESSITRGDALDRYTNKSITTGISQSSYIQTTKTSGSQDMSDATLASAAESAKESGDIVGSDSQPEHDFDDFYNNVFKDDVPLAVKISQNPTLEKLYASLFINKETIAVDGMQAIVGTSNVTSTKYKSVANANSQTVSSVSNLFDTVLYQNSTTTSGASNLNNSNSNNSQPQTLQQLLSSQLTAQTPSGSTVSLVELLQELVGSMNYARQDISNINVKMDQVAMMSNL